jgi:hypothetical protein
MKKMVWTIFNLNYVLGFYITDAAVSFFENLKSNKIGVITIVGKNRTGKSYLMNRVVLNKNSGFQVGHTINPCTKVSNIDDF